MKTETETWIGRTLLGQLTTDDRRYKYDYGGVEQTTDDLVAACAKLDLLMTGDGTELPPLERLFTPQAELEVEVETTLEGLQERGLVECVGERDRLGPPLERGILGRRRSGSRRRRDGTR